jgi:type I restriction enzyme S subunit
VTTPTWQPSTFGDCARLVLRRVDPQTTPSLPYVGLEHIGVGTLYLLGAGSCRDVASTSLLVEPGEVLFGKLRPYFRKVVRAPEPLVCTAEAWVMQARDGVDPGWLFYTAANPAFVDACSAASNGSRMPRADWAFAAAYPVALPPLDEQCRIAAALGALDAKIALNRRMNRTLEELTQAIFKSWFVRFDGHDDLVDSAIGPLPRGWTVGGVDAVADVVRDTVEPRAVSPDTPYVGLEHVPRRSVALDTWGVASDAESTKTRFQQGDILFGKLRPYFHKVVPAPLSGVSSTDILVIRPRHDDWRWFAFGHLYADAMVAHATAASDGTKMPRTTWKDLCRFPVALPPRERAREYSHLVAPMFERIAANVRECHALATVRDTLLPRLLSGEVRIGETALR